MYASDRPRSVIVRRHPDADALEHRIQTSVTVRGEYSRFGLIFIVEANGTDVVGKGKSVNSAVRAFARNYGLAG
jgi:hypothetical protein